MDDVAASARPAAPPFLRLKWPPPLHFKHLAEPFDGFLRPLPDHVGGIPSMMSVGEREFLYGLARDYYSGAGLIVDAGIFLGASTVCFGAGLKENPRLAEIVKRWKRPVVSFELGITNSQMPISFKRHQVGQSLKTGDSFAPIVEDHVAPVADLIDLRFGDIMETGGLPDTPRPAPVEILFLDILKSPEICAYCLKQYFPRLIPKRSILIQQDYINGDLPFIHITQEYFADRFEYVGELASSAVFRLIAPITQAEVDALFDAPPSDEAAVALVSRAAQRTVDNHRRVMIAFSKLRLILRAYGLDAAKQYWAHVESEYAPQVADERFRRVQNVIRAARYLCEVGQGEENEKEAVKISTGHRGQDHRRTDVEKAPAALAETPAAVVPEDLPVSPPPPKRARKGSRAGRP